MATTPVVITRGRGALIPLGMYDREGSIPGADLETGLTFEAADFQLQSDDQSFTNLTAEYRTFTSGSVKPLVGQTLTGATSTETCIVIGFVLSGGTWAGADAAGTIFVEQVSGVFQSENLNNTTTGGSNVLTIGGDFTPSIGAAMVGVGSYAALTAAEAGMSAGILRVQDQTGTQAFIDDLIPILTGGSIDATFLPVFSGLIHATKVKTTTTTTDYLLIDGPSADGGIPKGSVVFFVDQSATGEINGVVQSLAYTQSTGRLTVQTAPGIAVVAGDAVYIVAANPALAVIEEDTTVDIPALQATAQLDLDQITGADGVILATSQTQVGQINGAAATGTLSVTQCTSDLSGYVNDELIGRTITFTGGTANGQQARITDYASASGLVTFTTITTAPANADTFVIT